MPLITDLFGEVDNLTKDTTITIRISNRLWDKFDDTCKSKSISKSQAIRMFIDQYVNHTQMNFMVKSIMKDDP